MADEPKELKIAVYQEVCKSYHAVDDFRAKLLGFLPLASSGIFLLLGDALLDPAKKAAIQQYLGGIGIFGFMITLGLFAYEIRGTQRCAALIRLGKRLEDSLGTIGQFKYRPDDIGMRMASSFLGIRLSVTLAGRIIYSTIMAAWLFVALIDQPFRWGLPIGIFLLLFVASQRLYSLIGKGLDALDDKYEL
ncbi:MAG: hypothetical protein Kow00121_26590 [Elainellaceae cyanobacterium]